MFVVFNKDKIISYCISLSTVVVLFVLSFVISKKNDEIIQTSTNAYLSNEITRNELINEENCYVNNGLNDLNW